MNVNSAPLLEERPHFAQRALRPKISVILLSSGSIDQLERAVTAVSDAIFALNAQLVIVREESQDGRPEAALRIANLHRCQLAFAEQGSDRAALAARGLELVTGDIVTLRYDDHVGQGDWLDAFARGTPGTRQSAPMDERIVASAVSDERGVAAARSGADRSRSHSMRRSRETTSRSTS